MTKLVNGSRNLNALLEDGSLSLDADIDRPLHEARKIALRLDITSNVEVFLIS
jgi:hypothetical protein